MKTLSYLLVLVFVMVSPGLAQNDLSKYDFAPDIPKSDFKREIELQPMPFGEEYGCQGTAMIGREDWVEYFVVTMKADMEDGCYCYVFFTTSASRDPVFAGKITLYKGQGTLALTSKEDPLLEVYSVADIRKVFVGMEGGMLLRGSFVD